VLADAYPGMVAADHVLLTATRNPAPRLPSGKVASAGS
jgi:hypothetical protein